MGTSRRFLMVVFSGLVLGMASRTMADDKTPKERIVEVRERVIPSLKEELAGAGFALGNPLFIRIFKETRELEIWIRPDGAGEFRHWKTWPVVAMSGQLGPKVKQGDLQAPEGFYEVRPPALNPKSKYHLSFNIGYPNAYDQARKCTGDFIMVHGNQVSLGCFAMTDPVIEKIYLIAEAAFAGGQKAFGVHIFPFRMTAERMARVDETAWLSFWENLREGYDGFENTRLPPTVGVRGGRYTMGK